jgi:pilin isopeptide linkage protein
MDGQVKSVDSKPYEAYDFAGATIKITVPAGKTVGTLTFADIYYTKAGTYTYKITEQVSGEEGITDDTAEWTLVVVVTDTDGKLDATVTSPAYTSDDTSSDSTATFVNPYKPEPTEYAPQVIKNIDLVTGAPTSLDKTFKFDLEFITATAMDGYTDVSDGQLDAAEDAGGKQFVSDSVEIIVPAGEVTVGPASFKTIHFTKAGKYSYRITEKELLPPELGMAYDGSVWILTVTVTDTDGKLEVTGTSYTNDPTVTEVSNTNAIFVNPYRTGNLRVEKRVSGNGASTSTKFTFKVVLYTEELFTGIRTPLAGEYPVEIYDRKGNLIETATVVNGTVTFKLRHGEYAIIKSDPIGVKWEVEEEKYTGYSTSVETPNKGTIGLMESVSKWKNHRSTVPPIPRTGYGDGTTVKVGLGASLGVFLASAIGTVLQSRGTKKKKRGGSHAAE